MLFKKIMQGTRTVYLLKHLRISVRFSHVLTWEEITMMLLLPLHLIPAMEMYISQAALPVRIYREQEMVMLYQQQIAVVSMDFYPSSATMVGPWLRLPISVPTAPKYFMVFSSTITDTHISWEQPPESGLLSMPVSVRRME